MDRSYVVYNKRSCVTGKALFDFIRSNDDSDLDWRRSMYRKFKYKPKIIVRWGSSQEYMSSAKMADTIELNSKDAVERTTDKYKMAKALSSCEKLKFPKCYFIDEDTHEIPNEFYVRDANDHVRYDSSFTSTDKYILEPIEKTEEYRIHVFNNRVIGIYQKIPNNPVDKIYKDHNCTFKRLDMSNEETRCHIKGARPQAKLAVNTLGLLFGGVDVLRDKDNNMWVNEVNTAPSLNTPNIERWGMEILNFIREHHNPETEVDE